MVSEHLGFIQRFGCAIPLDTAPDERELALVNDVCNSDSVSAGSRKLREGAALLTRHSLKLLTTCASGLWLDQKDIVSALAVCSWALEVANRLEDRRGEAAVLWMFIGLLLANGRIDDAERMLARARKAVAELPDQVDLARQIEELARHLES